MTEKRVGMTEKRVEKTKKKVGMTKMGLFKARDFREGGGLMLMYRSLLFLFVLLMAEVAFAQTDPYGRVDSKNLGNISRQDYEASVLSTYRQNVPYVGVVGVDAKMPDSVNRINIDDYRSKVLSVFNRYDLDGDGMINKEEFNKIDRSDIVEFSVIDKNRDGFISKEEFESTITKRSSAVKNNADEKTARQKHDEANPTVKVVYDEINGYYVK